MRNIRNVHTRIIYTIFTRFAGVTQSCHLQKLSKNYKKKYTIIIQNWARLYKLRKLCKHYAEITSNNCAFSFLRHLRHWRIYRHLRDVCKLRKLHKLSVLSILRLLWKLWNPEKKSKINDKIHIFSLLPEIWKWAF